MTIDRSARSAHLASSPKPSINDSYTHFSKEEIRAERKFAVSTLNRRTASARSRSKIRRTLASFFLEIADSPSRFLASMTHIFRKALTAVYDRRQDTFTLHFSPQEYATLLALFDIKFTERQYSRILEIDEGRKTLGFYQAFTEQQEKIEVLMSELIAARRYIMLRLGAGVPARTPAFLFWDLDDFADLDNSTRYGDEPGSESYESHRRRVRNSLEALLHGYDYDRFLEYFPPSRTYLRPKNIHNRQGKRPEYVLTDLDEYPNYSGSSHDGGSGAYSPSDLLPPRPEPEPRLPRARSNKDRPFPYDDEESSNTTSYDPSSQVDDDWSIRDLGEHDSAAALAKIIYEAESPTPETTPGHPDYEYYSSGQFMDDVEKFGEERPPSKRHLWDTPAL